MDLAPATDRLPAPSGGDAGADAERVLDSPAVRVGRWVLFGLAAAYAVSPLLPLDPRPSWLDTWAYGVVLLLVVLAGLVRPLLVRENRLPWLLLALATISWALGDIYWAATFSDADDIPVPSPADVGYVALYPLAYAGLVLLARSVQGRVPASVWLDGVVTSLAVGALFSAFTVERIIADASGTLPEVITNLSYPVGDLVLIVVVVATLAMVRWRVDPVWWLLGAGFALFAVADTAYLFGVADGTYTDGTYPDGLWMLGLALVPLAGTLRRSKAAPSIDGLAALLVPILFSLVALVLLVVAAFVDMHPITIVLAGTCLVAAGMRTALTFEQQRALARSRTEAMTDELTTLGNRRVLDSRLPALSADAGVPGGHPLLVSILSIRHLSQINDTLGYRYGDGMLAELGTRLRDRLPAGAVPARLGGAEIAVLVPFDGNLPRAEQELRELVASVSEPVRVGTDEVDLELSAGVAIAPRHAVEGPDLLRCASEALRQAKATESEVEFYDPGRDAAGAFGPHLLPDLRRALEENEIGAAYLPKIDVRTGQAFELEAVLRWDHPDHGPIGAETLVPLAVRAGLSRRLTRVLLAEAVNRCAWWQRHGIRLGVAMDLSTADVLDSRLPYELARLTSQAGLTPAAIQLELAEDLLLMDPGRTRRALGQFRTLGVRLALDHYGKAAASLTRLRGMPVEEIKLDRSFVAPVLTSEPDAAVVRSTVALASSLGIETLADGVDSVELAHTLAGFGVRGVQGAVSGTPMLPPAALPGWLGGIRADDDRVPTG